MKECKTCHQSKPLSDFSPKDGGYAAHCKLCAAAAAREKYAQNHDHFHDRQLRRKHGITLEDYNRMLTLQEGRCAICKSESSKRVRKSGRTDKLIVDHCHVTGRIRKLLCHNCNTMLGHAKDDPERLREAAAYLDQVSEWHEI